MESPLRDDAVETQTVAPSPLISLITLQTQEVATSPLITLHGRPLTRASPRKVATPTRRSAGPESPLRRSPRVTSRLPIRRMDQPRFAVKSLNLPPDETVLVSVESPLDTNVAPRPRITPERLLEELRVAASEKRRQLMRRDTERPFVALDEDISVAVPLALAVLSLNRGTGRDALTALGESCSPLADRGAQLREGGGKTAVAGDLTANSAANVMTATAPITAVVNENAMTGNGNVRGKTLADGSSATLIDANDCSHPPDHSLSLDPLEVARTTIHNTKTNTGYRTCQLIYTAERMSRPRPTSPTLAFSRRTGASRQHLLNLPVVDVVEEGDGGAGAVNAEERAHAQVHAKRRLRFNPRLSFSTEQDHFAMPDLEVSIPLRSCLVRESQLWTGSPERPPPRLVHVKRVIYAGETDPLEANVRPRAAKRTLSAAKRK